MAYLQKHSMQGNNKVTQGLKGGLNCGNVGEGSWESDFP